MVKNDVGEFPLLLQGHWRDGRMPEKYARDRYGISIKSLKMIADKVSADWKQDEEENANGENSSEIDETEYVDLSELDDQAESEAEVTGEQSPSAGPECPEGAQFWVTAKRLDGLNPKRCIIHFSKAPHSRLVCSKVPLDRCESFGHTCPPFGRLCEICTVRP